MSRETSGVVRRLIWPAILDRESAKGAASNAYTAAVLVSAVTALLVVLGTLDVGIARDLGTSSAALVGVALFAGIAWGIRRQSRIAACLGLVIFTLERAWGYAQTGRLGGPLAVLLALWFVHGVRAAFAYHRYPSSGDVAREWDAA